MEPDWASDAKAAGGMGNTVLYRMVSDYPGHSCPDLIRDKMWIIGRTYSASVSRGAGTKGKEVQEPQGGLYLFLAQLVVKHGETLDRQISCCRETGRVSRPTVAKAIELHSFLEGILVDGIRSWRGEAYEMQKQRRVKSRASFVSKYLHFHAPMAFFILDSIIAKKLKNLREYRGKLEWPAGIEEKHKTNYGKHCIRMLDCAEQHYQDRGWTPRMIDGHLMGYIRDDRIPAEIAAARDNL